MDRLAANCKVRSFGQWVAAKCAAQPSANAGQHGIQRVRTFNGLLTFQLAFFQPKPLNYPRMPYRRTFIQVYQLHMAAQVLD